MRKPGIRIGLDVHLTLDGIGEITELLQDIADSLRALAQRQPAHLTGGRIVYIVQDSEPPHAYAITGVSAQDAKGQPVADAQLQYVVASTDPTVVTVAPDATDPTKGTVSFGNEGPATINVSVELADGTVVGALAASFQVTAGPVTSITGGNITFDGLTEAPPPTP